jgi:hypothetical protein
MLKFHPIQYIVIAITQTLALGLSRSYIDIFINTVLALTSVVIVSHKFRVVEILKFILTALPLATGVFIISYLFAIDGYSRFQLAILIGLRMLCLSIVSFVCMAHLPYNRLIIDLMQRGLLDIKFGYALLAISMVFRTIKYDFRKILYLSKVRKLNSKYTILPLMISAAGYSQVYAISLYSRGLSEKKTFYQPLISFGAADFLLLTIHIVVLSYFLFSYFANV